MKILKSKKTTVLLLFCSIVIFACSKNDDFANAPDFEKQDSVAEVRPNFALIDPRPPEVIKSVSFTAEDASPVIPLKSTEHNKYALVIGISDYKHDFRDLRYCHLDADSIEKHLIKRGYQVTKLIDEEADGLSMVQEVETLASRATENNEIAFYFAGHGAWVDGRGSDPAMVTWDGYYFYKGWIQEKFELVRPKKMIWLMDCCRAGRWRELLKENRCIGLASNDYTFAYDGRNDMHNGVYTHYLLEELHNRGYDDMKTVLEATAVNYQAWGDTTTYDTVGETHIIYNGNFGL